jgi:hypothetical protein
MAGKDRMNWREQLQEELDNAGVVVRSMQHALSQKVVPAS